jgi:hypothetical protein
MMAQPMMPQMPMQMPTMPTSGYVGGNMFGAMSLGSTGFGTMGGF